MPDNIDDIFARSSAASPEAEHTAASRASAAILADLHPVRPLAPRWLFTLALLAVSLFFAVSSAALLGMAGIHALAPWQRLLIFSLLLAIASFASLACARAMRPAGGPGFGSSNFGTGGFGTWSRGTTSLAAASVAFPALFALILRGYNLAHFVHEGIPCLRAGLLIALPTALVVAWILRRGFVLQWASAGLAAGVLAGLAGLGMLELHCPNLKAIHVMVWHVAVVVSSGLLGWIGGRIADQRRRRTFPQA